MDDAPQPRADFEAILLAEMALERGLVTVGQVQDALDSFAAGSTERTVTAFLRILTTGADLPPAAADALQLDLRQRIEEADGNARLALLRVRAASAHPMPSAVTSRRAEAQGAAPGEPRAEPEQRYMGFRPVGQGGMGVVYLALDTSLSREVAYKVMRPASLSPQRHTPQTPIEFTPPEPDTADSDTFHEHVQRFLQEARITGYLEHPSIVPVYELGETPSGVPYYTMRMVRGKRTLANAIAEFADAGIEHRLALLEPFLKVCDAIHYAHEQGIAHRDLKPANIGLGDYGEVVVLDWGLARLEARDDLQETKFLERLESLRSSVNLDTATGALGTPGYMSPEAALGHVAEMDARSDVYSLGVVLFEILTGQIPVSFRTFHEYVTRVTHEPAPRATDMDPDVPGGLAMLCSAALARDRDRRPESAGALAASIRAWQVESRVAQETDALAREARSALSAAVDLAGEELLHHLERVTAPCHRILHMDEEHVEATALLERCAALRARGLAEQEARARRALRRRMAVAALLVITLGTLGVSGVLEEKRREAEHARVRAEKAEDTAEARLSRAYADLARELTTSGRHAAAHLAAASALDTQPTRDAWAALGQVARHSYAHPKFLGAGFDALCAALHPDGRRLFIGCRDGRVRAWDLESKRALFELRAHESEIRSLLVTPDGRRLLTGGISGEISLVRVWDLATRELDETLEGFSGLVLDMQLSPSGQTLFALDSSRDAKGGGVHVWNIDSGRYLWRVEPIDHDPASWKSRAMCLSPDGRHLFLGARGVIVVWSLDLRRPVRTLRGGWGVVASLVTSGDGSRLYAAYRGNPLVKVPRAVLVWDWHKSVIQAELEGGVGGVRALRLAADGKQLFGTDVVEGHLLRWDLQRPSPPRDLGPGVPLLLDGRRDLLVTNHPQDSLHVRRASDQRLLFSPLPGHQGAIQSLALDASGRNLLSGGRDGRVGHWDARSGLLRRRFQDLQAPHGVVALLPGRPDVYLAAGGAYETSLQLRSAKSGELVRTLATHANRVHCIVAGPRGETVYSADAYGHIFKSFVQRENAGASILKGAPRTVLALSPDGTLLFHAAERGSAGAVTSAGFFDFGDTDPEDADPGDIGLVDIGLGEPDSKEPTATPSFGPTQAPIGIFHLPSATALRALPGHGGAITALTTGQDGLLYSGGADQRVRVWRIPRIELRGAPGTKLRTPVMVGARAPPIATLVGHRGPISALAVSQRTRRLYSAAADRTPWVLQGAGYREDSVIRCWDLRSMRLAAQLEGHRGWVSSLALSMDGAMLYSGGLTDHTIIRWELDARAPACRDVAAKHGFSSAGSPTFCMGLTEDGRHLYTGTGALELLGQHFGFTLTLHWDLAARLGPYRVQGVNLGMGACGTEDGRSMLVGPRGRYLYVGRWLPSGYGAVDEEGPCGTPDPDAPNMPALVESPRQSGGTPPESPRSTREPTVIPAGILVGVADLRNASTGSGYLVLPARQPPDAALDIAASPDGSRLYVSGRSGYAYEYALPERRLVHRYDVAAGPASAIAVSPPSEKGTSARLFVGTRRGFVSVWDAETRKEVRRFRAHLSGVGAIAVSRDGLRLFTAGGGRGVPDEESPVLRRGDTLIKMWDAVSLKLLAVLGGHEHYVEALSLSNDGALLVSAGQDGAVMLWDAVSGVRHAVLDATAGAVRAIALTGDGTRLYTGGHDPRIFEWSVGWFLDSATERLEAVQAETGLRVRNDQPDVEVSLWNHLMER